MSSEPEKLIREMMEIIVRKVDPKQVILFGSQGLGARRGPIPTSTFSSSRTTPSAPAFGLHFRVTLLVGQREKEKTFARKVVIGGKLSSWR
jgi:hypothetical protein